MSTENELKVGDKVWTVQEGYKLAILCTIIEIDDYFRKQEPQAYLFYTLDEPIGHDLAEWELISDKEKAKEYLEEIHKDYDDDFKVYTLDEYRNRRIDFIVKTWRSAGCNDEFVNDYIPKEHLEKWFTIQDILDGKV